MLKDQQSCVFIDAILYKKRTYFMSCISFINCRWPECWSISCISFIVVDRNVDLFHASRLLQVAGMLIYFILTGGKHPFGEKNIEIQVNIQQNWSQIMFLNDEANHLLTVMLNTPHTKRPTVSALLKFV